jgi:DNA replication initiation complex subunit (GINS family)
MTTNNNHTFSHGDSYKADRSSDQQVEQSTEGMGTQHKKRQHERRQHGNRVVDTDIAAAASIQSQDHNAKPNSVVN